MDRPSVGVVVVNWNGLADTVACLNSLGAAHPRPARVIVVDNGSTDGSLERLRASGANPGLSIIAAGANRGFSGANNLGLAALARDPTITHFLLLNNDATVHPDFFAQISRTIAAVPGAGIVGNEGVELVGVGEGVWPTGSVEDMWFRITSRGTMLHGNWADEGAA